MEGQKQDKVESFRDTLYTVDKSGRRRWVYSSWVDDFYFRARVGIAVLLMLFYLLMPWIQVKGKQAIRFDLAHRHFTFLGTTFWATDTLFLVLVLGGLALSLFFFTSLFGRVWCGWACPETLFLEFVFRPIERLIEGNAAQRARLDTAPWSFNKLKKKLLKHSLCAAISWIIASTAVAYFVGSEPLILMMSDWPHKNPGPFFLTQVVMALFAFQFGWFREQFCTILCPYARFQSVLMDSNSLVVGYDSVRGEPRGKMARKKAEQSGKGDCIDCKLCVRVCPTGIDIRNGLQLECVSCTQCIDACDSIMTKIGRPKGLIRYDTENRLRGKEGRFLRPRVVVYGGLLLTYVIVFAYLLLNRQTSEFQLLRVGTEQVYQRIAEDRITNQFEARIGNKADVAREYSFRVSPAAVEVVVPLDPFRVQGGAVATVPVYLHFPEAMLEEGTLSVLVEMKDDAGYVEEKRITLLGPDTVE